jgi:hypothetical protein
MDKQQRSYMKERLQQVFRAKKEQIHAQTVREKKPITGKELKDGISHGKFKLLKSGPLEGKWGNSIEEIFDLPEHLFDNKYVDEDARGVRMSLLTAEYNKALDALMLNKVDTDLLRILQNFEAFSV